MRVASGATSRIAASTRSIVRAISSVERSSREAHVGGHQHLVGAEVHGQQLDQVVDRRRRSRIACSIASRDCGSIASPSSSFAFSWPSRKATTSRIRPMIDRGRGVEGRLAGQRGEPDAERGDQQAADRRRVLGQHGQDLRVLGVAQRRPGAAAAAGRVELPVGGAPRVALEADRERDHDQRDRRDRAARGRGAALGRRARSRSRRRR